MDKFGYYYRRVLAYLFDFLLIQLVVTCITGTQILNPQYKSYHKYYDEYLVTYKEYNYYDEQQSNDIKTCNDLKKAIEKGNITEEEYINKYNELEKDENYEENCLSLVNDYNNHKINKEEYIDKLNNLAHNVDKNSLYEYILLIVLSILYLVLFQGFTGGQTLGKKILHLKVVNKDGRKRVSYKQLLIRSILLFDIIYYVLIALNAYILSLNTYVFVNNLLYYAKDVLLIIICLSIVLLKDSRGIPDLIANTKVIDEKRVIKKMKID